MTLTLVNHFKRLAGRPHFLLDAPVFRLDCVADRLRRLVQLIARRQAPSLEPLIPARYSLLLAIVQNTRRRDDVSAPAAMIDAPRDIARAASELFARRKPQVESAARSPAHRVRLEFSEALVQRRDEWIVDRLAPAWPIESIDIDDEDACASRNADVCVRRIGPPLADTCRVAGRILEPVLRRRLLRSRLEREDSVAIRGILLRRASQFGEVTHLAPPFAMMRASASGQ